MFRLNNYNFGRSALLGLGAGLLLTACGGGGGGGGGSSSGGGESAAYQGVAGPLDAVQEPLSTQVLTPLSEAAAGTPLEGAVSCVDQVVVQDTIDVLDSILGAVDPTSMNDPQVAFAAAAENIQAAVNELLADLPVLLTSLAGQGDCTGTGGGASDGSNPLAGTPLAPLGDALAPLFAAGSGFGGGFGGEGGQTLDLTALQALTDQLSAAFNDGLSNLPAEVADAPVLGGLLVTLQTTFNDLNTTVAALDDGDGAATAGAIAGTLDNLLSNLLINVVPVGFIEEQAGQGGVFSSQIEYKLGVMPDGLHLSPVSDQPGILHAFVQHLVRHEHQLVRIKTKKSVFKSGPFVVHQGMLEPGPENAPGQRRKIERIIAAAQQLSIRHARQFRLHRF